MADTTAAIPSGTIMLLRDAPRGLEVFMVVRHHRIDFAAGAMVFPGGKVHPGDVDPALRELCAGVEKLNRGMISLRVAAIREAYEECGILLARRPESRHLVRATEVASLDPRYRSLLDRGTLKIGDFLRRENLRLACDLLVPFAHWITPTMMPKRFNTHFYLAAAPEDQAGMHDGKESVDSQWIRPQDALRAADSGRRMVIFPTRMNLKKLAESSTVKEAIERARESKVVTVLPEVDTSGDRPILRIPASAGYGITEAPLEGPDA